MSTALVPALPESCSLSGFSRNGLTCRAVVSPLTFGVRSNAADFWFVVAVMAFSSMAAGGGAVADGAPPPAAEGESSAPHAASATALVSRSGKAIRFIIAPDDGRRRPSMAPLEGVKGPTRTDLRATIRAGTSGASRAGWPSRTRHLDRRRPERPADAGRAPGGQDRPQGLQ